MPSPLIHAGAAEDWIATHLLERIHSAKRNLILKPFARKRRHVASLGAVSAGQGL